MAVAVKDASEQAAKSAATLGGSLDDQAEAAKSAAASVADSGAEIAAAMDEAGKAAAKAAAETGASADEWKAAYAEAADAAKTAAEAISESADAAGQAAADQAARLGASVDAQKAAYAEAAGAAKASAEEQTEAMRAATAEQDDLAATSAKAQESAAAARDAATATTISSMKSVGSTMTKYVTVPVLAAAAAGVDFAINFQKQMTLVHTQAGVGAKETARLANEVKSLASGGAQQGPTKLAEGLYQLTSVGERGKEVMLNLKAASEGAALGNADLEETTSALAATTTSYNIAGSHAKEVMAMLSATVGVGKMRMDELVASFQSGILPIAAKAGVSLQSLGAAVAVMTDRGVPATRAMTYLRQAIFYLSDESTKPALEALEKIGLTSEQVSSELSSPDGLMKVVTTLHERLQDFGKGEQLEILKDLGGGARSATGLVAAYESLESHISNIGDKYEKIGQKVSSFNSDVEAQSHTISGQLNAAWSSIQTSLIDFGQTVMPILAAVFGAIAKVAEAFGNLPAPVRTVIAVAALLAAALGPVLVALASVVSACRALGLAFGSAATEAATSSEGMAAKVTAADGEMVTANEAVGASFTAWLGPIAAAAAALYGIVKAEEAVIGGHITELLGGNQPGEKLKEGMGVKNAPYSLKNYGALKGNSVEQQIVNFFEERGFTKIAAAGIAGNVAQESSFDPNAPGGGLFQDIGGRGAAQGASVATQLEAAYNELRTSYHGIFEKIQHAKTPQEAANIFAGHAERGIEGFEDPEEARANYAHREQAALEAFERAGGHLSKASTVETNIPKGPAPVSKAMSTFEKEVEAAKKKAEVDYAAGVSESPAQKAASKAATKAEDEAKKRREEHERKIEKDTENGQKELNSILGAIHGGKLSELDSALKGAHERGLVQLEHTLSNDHTAALSKLDTELVAAHKKGIAALDAAIVKEWNLALAELTKTVNSAVEKAVAAWQKSQETITANKYKSGMREVENGPEAALKKEQEEGEAKEATATERANQRGLTEAQKKLKEAKWTGNKEEIEKAKEALTVAEEAITNFARNQDEKRKQKKIEEEKKAITETQTTEQESLQARVKEYEKATLAQTAALEKQLAAGKISIQTFIKEVNAILQRSGAEGLTISISAGTAGTLSSPPPAQPIGAGSGAPGTPERPRVPISEAGDGGGSIGKASGGMVYPGIEYEVGEVGPERFTPSIMGSITPASAPGGGPLVGNHFYGPVTMGSKRDADRFAHKLAHRLMHGGKG